jgi:DNA-directed RNA polymerase specialized sigma24 family protein
MARELVAEAFARAWASWEKVGGHPAPQAWVVRTALNVRISRWRRHRREVAVPDPGMISEPALATSWTTWPGCKVPARPGRPARPTAFVVATVVYASTQCTGE